MRKHYGKDFYEKSLKIKNERTANRLKKMRGQDVVGDAFRRQLTRDKPIANVPNIAPGFNAEDWRNE